jgi:hypothetical protein
MHPLSHYEATKYAYDEQQAWDERHRRRLRSAPLPRPRLWARLRHWLHGQTARPKAERVRADRAGTR